MRAPDTRRPGVGPRLLLVTFGIVLGGLIAEASLRVFGFTYATFPIVQFGWPEPREIRDVFVPDRDLFWVTRDYAAKLAEAHRMHPAIVFLGDSCTAFSNWPEQALERLRMQDPTLGRGVALAVPGWSSEQGRRQFQRDVLPLHPRLVTFYFGWNDHWRAFGPSDPDVHASVVSYWLAQHVRLAQLVTKARLAAATRAAGTGNRVPVTRYRENIETLAHLARDAGMRAVFITAPTSHERGKEPPRLSRRHLLRLEDLVPLHAAYVQATREAAAAGGGEICDAAAAFVRLPSPITQYFTHDGIHLSERGASALAAIVSGCIAPGR